MITIAEFVKTKTSLSLKAQTGPEIFLCPSQNPQCQSVPTDLSPGQTFTVTIQIDPKGQSLAGADLVLDYDSSKLEVQSSNDPNSPFTTGLAFKTYLGPISNACGGQKALGRLSLSGIAYDSTQLPTPPPHNPLSTLATFASLNFKAIQAGTAHIYIRPATDDLTDPNTTLDSNLVDATTGQDILAETTDTSFNIVSGPTPSITPIPTPTSCPPSPTPTPTPATPSITPTPTPSNCSGFDLNCDDSVCGQDAAIFVGNFHQKPPYNCPTQNESCNPDFNHDGEVNAIDASMLMSHWEVDKCH